MVALIEELAGRDRHYLDGGVPAMWAGERALQLKGGHCLQDPYRNLYASCVHMAVLASGALNLQGRVLDTEPFLQRGRQ